MFSVFETYTEWIVKGKLRLSVESGKKVNITTDRFQLVVDYQTLDNQSDSDLVIALADRLIPVFRKLRNRHSAVESNIHSLETRRIIPLPRRRQNLFQTLCGLGVCAYNLCRIGRKLQADFKAGFSDRH